MERVFAAVGAGFWVAFAGCSAPVEPPPLRARPEVLAEPLLDGHLARSPGFRLKAGSGDPVLPRELSLWTGELSEAQLSRLRRGDVPATLVDRAVPALAWAEADGARLRPSVLLQEAARVTLLSASLGKLGEWQVGGGPALERRFPASGAPGAGFALLCGDEAPGGAWELPLEPGQARAELEPGFGSYQGEPCVAVRWTATSAGPFVLPPEIEGFSLDPEPYVAGEGAPEPLLEVECLAGELPLGPLCAAVEDDRLVLTTGSEGLLLRAALPAGVELAPALPGSVLRGFEPDTPQSLAISLITLQGDEVAFEVEFRTAPARVRWVLNEVLANPLGAEPAQEWVELVNASAASASLAGTSLADAGGQVPLPDFVVEPGEYVVLVSDAFGESPQDVPLDPAARQIHLPQLGKSGLSNSGEPLELRAADGSVLSRFPALPAKRAGVSLARRSLDSPDTDSAEFGEHAAPGASPGAPNQLR